MFEQPREGVIKNPVHMYSVEDQDCVFALNETRDYHVLCYSILDSC